MWWKCDVKFFRTILRLKVWARSELDARTKIETMYQVATIQNLTLADDDTFPNEKELPESAVEQIRRFQSWESRSVDCQN